MSKNEKKSSKILKKMSVLLIQDTTEPLIPGMTHTKAITHKYTMNAELEKHIRSMDYQFGYGELSNIVYLRTYSRLKDNGEKETFHDTVIRVVNGIVSMAKDYRINHSLRWNEDEWNDIAKRFAEAMLKLQFLPPGRGLWIGGSHYAYERGSAASNNCGFCSVSEGFLKSICWTMDSLMCGCGIGFDTTAGPDFDQLIEPTDIELSLLNDWKALLNIAPPRDYTVYTIHDSRQGWVKSVYLLINSYFDGSQVVFDYSQLRALGAPIKGFGGESSGPEPLRILHQRIRIFMACYFRAQTIGAYEATIEMLKRHIDIFPEDNMYERWELTEALKTLLQMDEATKVKKSYGKTRLIADIFNSVGICIVAGNVRRSSEIALGLATDVEFLNLKNYKSFTPAKVSLPPLPEFDENLEMAYKQLMTFMKECSATVKDDKKTILRPILDYLMSLQLNDVEWTLPQLSKLMVDVLAVITPEDTEEVVEEPELNPERRVIGWMSNNTVCLDTSEDFEMLPQIAEQIKRNGEPGIYNRINAKRYGRFGRKNPIGREAEEDKAYGLNPCVSGDTIIQTSTGSFKVTDLVGKPFSAYVDGRVYESTVEGFWCNGQKEVFEVTLENGCSVKVTSNHQLLTYTDGVELWKELKDLTEGDDVVINDNNCVWWNSSDGQNNCDNFKWTGQGTFDEGYFCGLFIQDGTILKDGSIQLCVWISNNAEENDAISTISLLTETVLDDWQKDDHLGPSSKYTLVTEKFNDIAAKFYLDENKHIPEFGCYDFIVGLLRAIFDTHCTIKHDNTAPPTERLIISLQDSNKNKLQTVQRLLLSMGIYSSFCKFSFINMSELTIVGSEAVKFYNRVGLFDEIKNNQLYKYTGLHSDDSTKSFTSKFVSAVSKGVENVYDCTIPEISSYSANGILSHNCSEICLESFEYCNLAEIFPTRCSTLDEKINAATLATIYASTVSLQPTHWEYSNKVIAKNRRIGISMSGIVEEMNKVGVSQFTKECRILYKTVREVNERLANEVGVPASIRVTTVKPSGTISQLAGVPSGIHYATHKYCIRRVRVGSTSKLVDILVNAGYSYEVDAMAGEGTLVFSFPLYQGDARAATEVSMWEQANNVNLLQREWADNSVSCTLYFDPKSEGRDLEHLLAGLAPTIKCISCLPHTEKGSYKQMPYEGITKAQYEAMLTEVKAVSTVGFNDEAVGVRGCDGDTCDMNAFKLAKDPSTPKDMDVPSSINSKVIVDSISSEVISKMENAWQADK